MEGFRPLDKKSLRRYAKFKRDLGFHPSHPDMVGCFSITVLPQPPLSCIPLRKFLEYGSVTHVVLGAHKLLSTF